MIWLIIITAAWLIGLAVFLFVQWTDSWSDLADKVMYTAFGTITSGAFAFLILVLINLVTYGVVGEHTEKVGEAKLAALADNVGPSGSFFLGSGNIDDEASFFYYEKNGDAYTLEHVDADNVTIVESSETPRIEFYESVTNNQFWHLGGMGERSYKFYIPEGSIMNNFTLDAE